MIEVAHLSIAAKANVGSRENRREGAILDQPRGYPRAA